MYTTINIWFSQKPRSGGDIFRGFNDNFSDIMQNTQQILNGQGVPCTCEAKSTKVVISSKKPCSV